ncbi:MAG: 30S ribosomal protein S17 [bacterium]|nr:30S ribosomal protein S17 [bacterium]
MKKTFQGVVVSTSMMKTVVVEVERKFRHKLYQKVIKRSKRFNAHNELEGVAVGDEVAMQETRPLSKTKRFIIIEKITK